MKIEKRNYNVFDFIRIPFKCTPINVLLIFIFKILDGILPTIQIFITAYFVDTAISVVSGGEDYSKVCIPTFLLIFLVGYKWISSKIVNFINVRLEINIRETLRLAMVNKRAKLSYIHIENSDSWDLISRVCRTPEKTFKLAYLNILNLGVMIIKVLGFALVLISQVWWSALLVLIISIPLFMISIKGGQRSYNAERESEKFKRKYEYLDEVLTGREAVDERTLFSFTKGVGEVWSQAYETSRKIKLKVDGLNFVKMKLASTVTSLITILVMIVLIKPVSDKTITIGMFISLVNAISSLVEIMSWQLSNITTQFAKYLEYLRDYEKFSCLSEDEDALEYPLNEGIKFNTIEFKDVTFKYPGTDNYILDGMSFIIENGKHYAFVGINGAGKTTITKLITGLYKKYEGQILIDGKDICEYGQSYLKALCSVVYQDFAKYFISFKDNLSIGRINGIKTGTNDKLIYNAINTMELSDVIDRFPNGINSYLGKIKQGGVDLSGGQWQRIAMARSIINEAPLKILDEPTAALDPISESNIYRKFEEISKGSTTIFISHRLGSTKLADEIFVLGKGKVIEKGTHDELMDRNGVYTKMYESQKGWYI